MKRSSFLKSLLGIAVAPMAIAKAIEQCDVEPKYIFGIDSYKDSEISKGDIGTKGWIEQIEESDSHIWYETTEQETKDRLDEMHRKMLAHYGKMNINEFATKIL